MPRIIVYMLIYIRYIIVMVPTRIYIQRGGGEKERKKDIYIERERENLI